MMSQPNVGSRITLITKWFDETKMYHIIMIIINMDLNMGVIPLNI